MTELRRSTLRDVARLAGVSEQTVSNVVNDRAAVKAETRERVLKAAETLDYRVNRAARLLKTSRSSLLALIFPNITNPIYAEVASVVAAAAAARDYSVMLANSGRDAQAERRLVEVAADLQVAGILLSSVDPEGHAARRALRYRLPCVQFLNRDPAWTGDYFGAANVKGARDAVAGLIALGHRRIGHLRGLSSFVAEERLRGHIEAHAEAGLAHDPALVAQGQFSREGGAEACAALIEAHPEMTAVFCASDLMAYGALDAAAARGLRVPDDLSVVGFDDTSFSSLAGVSLSTVRFDIGRLAGRAVDRLIARIEGRMGDDASAVTEIVPCEIVRRGSAAAPGR